MVQAVTYEIQYEETADGGGTFFVETDGQRVALIRWEAIPEGMDVVTTKAEPSMRGTGVAKQLVAKVVEHARANNLSVRGSCSYAKKVIGENPDTVDLLID